MKVLIRRGQKDFKCPKCESVIELEHSRFNSNAKGSGFESWVAREISFAMYGNSETLCRTPLSGGLGSRWPFDLYPPKIGEDNFPFGVECKFRNGWQLEDLLYRKSSKPSGGKRKADTFILDWWQNTIADARKHNKIPILVIKKNREKPLVVFNPGNFKEVEWEQIGWGNVIIFSDAWVVDFEEFKRVLKRRYEIGIK